MYQENKTPQPAAQLAPMCGPHLNPCRFWSDLMRNKFWRQAISAIWRRVYRRNRPWPRDSGLKELGDITRASLITSWME
ncbi:unnamed protein product, partial [Iphiclides podalirius]